MNNNNVSRVTVSTGIPELDNLLCTKPIDPKDGESKNRGIELPKGCTTSNPNRNGLILMIKGEPGTGKTTLAFQMALHLTKEIRNRNFTSAKSEYFSLEQNVDTFENKFVEFQEGCREAKELGIEAWSIAESDKWGELLSIWKSKDGSQNTELISGPLSDTLKFTSYLSQKESADIVRPVVVLDGLNSIYQQDLHKLDFRILLDTLRKRALISIIVYEPKSVDDHYLEFLSDTIIELKNDDLQTQIEYSVRMIRVWKSRYQNAALGWHQYKIRKWGFEIYPSIQFQIHHTSPMYRQYKGSLHTLDELKQELKKIDEISSVDCSIISKILGKIRPGSTTFLVGPNAAHKTTLLLDYLYSPETSKMVLKEKNINNKSLLLSMTSNQSTLMKCDCCKRCINDNCKNKNPGKNCLKKIIPYILNPSCVTAPELFYFIKMRLNVAFTNLVNVKKMGFLDLEQLEHRFPLLFGEPMFLSAFLEFFRTFKHPVYGSSQPISQLIVGNKYNALAKAAIATSDNVLFCFRSKALIGKSESVVLKVYKREDSSHQLSKNKLIVLPIRNKRLSLPKYNWNLNETTDVSIIEEKVAIDTFANIDKELSTINDFVNN